MENSSMQRANSPFEVSYEVKGRRIDLNIDFVRRYLVRGQATPTDQDCIFFMNTCASQKLNPMVSGEVYLIKTKASDPAQLVIGKTAYLRRAYENPDYICKEDGITVMRPNGDIVQKEGLCLYPGEQLLGGWCRIHYMRAGRERTAFREVSLAEYNRNQSNWQYKPATMIAKTAISQAVREAFPNEFEGLYSEEEMIASGAVPPDCIPVQPYSGQAEIRPDAPPVQAPAQTVREAAPVQTSAAPPKPVSQEQRQMMFRTAQQEFGREEGNRIVRAVIESEGLTSTSGMKEDVWKRVMLKINAEVEQHRAETAAAAEEVPAEEPPEPDVTAEQEEQPA